MALNKVEICGVNTSRLPVDVYKRQLLEEGVTIRSAVKEAQEASLEALAEKIASSLQ